MKNSIFGKKGFWPLAGAAALVAVACPALAQTAAAENQDKPVLDFGLSAGFSTYSLGNTHFGAGQLGANLNKDIARSEGYIAPRVNMTWSQGDSSTVYGGLRAVTSVTRGDGDSWGTTIGEHWQYDGRGYTNTGQPVPGVIGKDMTSTSVDWAYIGWKSGNIFPALGQDGLDLSFGRQNFQLGDGMVLVDGNDEANQSKGIYWLDPRQAWNNTAIARINVAPFRAELFALQTDETSADDTIVGANFELVDAKMGNIGVSYFDVPHSKMPGREGLSVWNVHGRGRPIAALPILELAAEHNVQKGGSSKRDAKAWFVEANMFMPFLPWYPTLGYRYSSFSGDDATTLNTNEGWDYLHNGATSRGFGYWYQGIVVGTYETRLTNLNTHFVHLTIAPPVQGSWVKLMYYNYRFDQANTGGLNPAGNPIAVSSNNFASEWDLVLGYSPTKKVDYMMIYGVATPDQGGKERYAQIGALSSAVNKSTNLNATMLQFTMLVHF